MIISHGDLPLAHDLSRIVRRGHIVLVPDQRRDGTNVLSRPCSVELPAAYGGGSFRNHLDAALSTGSPVTVRVDQRLSIDIDTIDDCRHPLVVPVLQPVLGDRMPV